MIIKNIKVDKLYDLNISSIYVEIRDKLGDTHIFIEFVPTDLLEATLDNTIDKIFNDIVKAGLITKEEPKKILLDDVSFGPNPYTATHKYTMYAFPEETGFNTSTIEIKVSK